MKKVLVVAPGRKTRGGITSVIKALEKTEVWNKHKCHWVETYIDRNALLKVFFFAKSFVSFVLLLPFYKIVHIHFSWTTSAFRKLFFFIYAQILGKKIIIHLHSGAEPIIQSKATWLYNYMFRNASTTILLADTIKQQLEKHYTIKKSEVVFNPSLIPIKNIQKANVRKELIILFAGTITEKKGTDDLILSFSKIARQYPDWQLVLAGNGEIEKSKLLAQKCNISEQVRFTGWITGREKEELFNKASVFCLPSYTEGFPMAVLDAWAYGIPVITTPVGGLPDVLLHGINSLVFQPGNIDELTQNMDKLMADSDLRQKLSRASIQLSYDFFNIDKISGQLDELYLKIA